MIGLIFLFSVIVLFSTLIAVSKWLTRGMTGTPAAIFFTRLAIIFGFFPLALSDEIIGAMQHAYWCKAYGVKSADLSRAKGKEVIMYYGLYSENSKSMPFSAISIQRHKIVLKDAKTNEELAKYHTYGATSGGWFKKYIVWTDSQPIFAGSNCSEKRLFSREQITVVKWEYD